MEPRYLWHLIRVCPVLLGLSVQVFWISMVCVFAQVTCIRALPNRNMIHATSIDSDQPLYLYHLIREPSLVINRICEPQSFYVNSIDPDYAHADLVLHRIPISGLFLFGTAQLSSPTCLNKILQVHKRKAHLSVTNPPFLWVPRHSLRLIVWVKGCGEEEIFIRRRLGSLTPS